MAKIMLITLRERNTRTGRIEEVVSHGIDLATDRTVIMPCETPQSLGAVRDPETGEWVLQEPARGTTRDVRHRGVAP